ncbi:MAG: ATP-grasp domain-containing protein [Candidatus Helarchaeota archaeon]
MNVKRDDVWIIGKDTHEFRRLKEEAAFHEISYSFYSLEDLVFPLPTIPEICLIRASLDLFIPHSVIYLLNVIETLELEGCKVIPSSHALKICDKMSFYFFWKKHLSIIIKMPETYIGTCFSAVIKKLDQDKKYVFKPMIGGLGEDITLVSLKDEAGLQSLFRKYKILLLQEYVDNLDYDIRTIMIGPEKPIQFMRYSKEDFRHNLHQGGHGKTKDEIRRIDPNIDEHLRQSREVAQKIQELTGLVIFGLDTLPSKDGTLYLLEINPFIGFRGAEKTLKDSTEHGNVAGKIINYLNSLITLD